MTPNPNAVLATLDDAGLARLAAILAGKVAAGMIGPGTRAALAAVVAEMERRGLPVPVAGTVVTDERWRWTGRHHAGRRRMRPGDRPNEPVVR